MPFTNSQIPAEGLNAAPNGCKTTASLCGHEGKTFSVLVIADDRAQLIDRLWQVVMSVSSQEFQQSREKVLTWHGVVDVMGLVIM